MSWCPLAFALVHFWVVPSSIPPLVFGSSCLSGLFGSDGCLNFVFGGCWGFLVVDSAAVPSDLDFGLALTY